ncbi:Alpha-fucosidase A [Colletotrichum orbiculare MAFF 240422]|uniref:Alpha-fucosidase A n=1 Tax=Colletotrichum orbiculare (strain 104-T / ATCC 96160 / CBS 514.97 / LARS 414 / MAFF 240422) TaxID=1213857 RepID=N4VLL6_COLOR|nr:Alpha-fucosidase A [Colletotrichum orbiculare MAFF 240422]
MKAQLSGLLFSCAGLTLSEARSLWSSHPAVSGDKDGDSYLLKVGYPVGNGKLGAIPFGDPGMERVNLNIDSLWSGGPFENPEYTGGNPAESKADALPNIRSKIFDKGTGDVDALLGSGNNFGSNRVLANLLVSLDGIREAEHTDYRRTLDLTTGIHTTTFSANGASFETSVFCSYPDQVCVYHASSNASLPVVKVGYENGLVEPDTFGVTCGDDHVRFSGATQLEPQEGMKFDSIARVIKGNATTECAVALVVTPEPDQKSVTVVVGAETNYDQKKGKAEDKYSFRGEDPGPVVELATSKAASKPFEQILADHLADYQNLAGAFELNLPDPRGSADKETAGLISGYVYTDGGDPFVEALLFDYSRHLLVASSRENSLPANLQGRWTEELWPAWSADYHANINVQMNYWAADQTGLGRTQDALWNYMEDTWVPRGTETARLLYGADGWVVHNEMNIFGHTAMKEGTTWANYPAAAAWMMQHVWDNFEYTQDFDWFSRQGYPLIKGVAQFWLSQLQEDTFSDDGTLVVNPCNSPETGPTTFGCAHYQQLVHQVFEAVLRASAFVPESDAKFLENVTSQLQRLDKGFHVSDWNGVKEWKLPDSYGYDGKSDHRHLSHLTGWYPGYSLSSFLGGYANATVQDAVRETLVARGMGNAGDANAGWAKVWRAACWARLNDTARAYEMLRYAIDENFAPNGFSMYSGESPPFQIDANFGLGGAVLSMLVVDLPLPYESTDGVRTVVLGPAIPAEWGDGSVKGLRIRGGAVVDFKWDGQGIVTEATVASAQAAGGNKVRVVNVQGKVLADI